MYRTALAALLASLTLIGAAHAAGPGDVANLGYSVTAVVNGPCTTYRATGYGAVNAQLGSNCDASFPSAIDAFIAGHEERKLAFEYPTAVTARTSLQGKGYSVSTDYATPAFTVTGGCNVNQTVTAANLAALDASLAAAAPCPAAPPAVPPASSTPTTTTTAAPAPPTDEEPAPEPAPAPTGPTTEELAAQIATLQSALEQLAGRIDALQRANEAAWTAYVDALGLNQPAYVAALAARSAGLNAMYELG